MAHRRTRWAIVMPCRGGPDWLQGLTLPRRLPSPGSLPQALLGCCYFPAFSARSARKLYQLPASIQSTHGPDDGSLCQL